MKRLLMESALKKYEGDLAVAQANLEAHLEFVENVTPPADWFDKCLHDNPVGIGKHPDVMEEVAKLVMNIHDAQGCIDVIINTWKEETDNPFIHELLTEIERKGKIPDNPDVGNVHPG